MACLHKSCSLDLPSRFSPYFLSISSNPLLSPSSQNGHVPLRYPIRRSSRPVCHSSPELMLCGERREDRGRKDTGVDYGCTYARCEGREEKWNGREKERVGGSIVLTALKMRHTIVIVVCSPFTTIEAHLPRDVGILGAYSLAGRVYRTRH
jgi:hypothetical protein